MSIFKQKTISKEILIEGIGLHSGKKASMVIKPANPNTGIVFKRVMKLFLMFLMYLVQFYVQLFLMIMV